MLAVENDGSLGASMHEHFKCGSHDEGEDVRDYDRDKQIIKCFLREVMLVIHIETNNDSLNNDHKNLENSDPECSHLPDGLSRIYPIIDLYSFHERDKGARKGELERRFSLEGKGERKRSLAHMLRSTNKPRSLKRHISLFSLYKTLWNCVLCIRVEQF
jgi:hypothetical protein